MATDACPGVLKNVRTPREDHRGKPTRPAILRSGVLHRDSSQFQRGCRRAPDTTGPTEADVLSEWSAAHPSSDQCRWDLPAHPRRQPVQTPEQGMPVQALGDRRVLGELPEPASQILDRAV